jgi:hypothetical protein
MNILLTLPRQLAGEGRGEGVYVLKWLPPHLHPLPRGRGEIMSVSTIH